MVCGHLLFGGFKFIAVNRAFERLSPVENDEIYGDYYSISGREITDIGNNVLIKFNGLDFGSGASSVTVCGRTMNEVNPIHLKYTGEDGVQHTQLLEFRHSFDYSEQTFSLERIVGKNDISFVFMPGSRFDFEWFSFK